MMARCASADETQVPRCTIAKVTRPRSQLAIHLNGGECGESGPTLSSVRSTAYGGASLAGALDRIVSVSPIMPAEG